jgi:hypothetical protein
MVSPSRSTAPPRAEILKLKAAKSGGWLSEEEFDTEVKRLIREHNGEVLSLVSILDARTCCSRRLSGCRCMALHVHDSMRLPLPTHAPVQSLCALAQAREPAYAFDSVMDIMDDEVLHPRPTFQGASP